MCDMNDLEDFWDSQKILEEFNSDVITPVMTKQTPTIIELSPEEQARSKIEPLIGVSKAGCYICTIRTNTKLTKSGHPICISCVVEHLVENE